MLLRVTTNDEGQRSIRTRVDGGMHDRLLEALGSEDAPSSAQPGIVGGSRWLAQTGGA